MRIVYDSPAVEDVRCDLGVRAWLPNPLEDVH